MTSAAILPYQIVGSGETLVLVHGYLGGACQWQGILPKLSQYFKVVTLDLAGFGGANHLSSPQTIGHHAHSVLATLDSIGIDRFHLLGHSMGGMVVQEMVKLAPSKVNRLVLYATGPLGSIPGRFETMARSRERLKEDGLVKTARRISATWLLDQEASPAYPALAALAVLATESAASAGLFAMEHWDGRAYLPQISQPTIILWGEGDRSYGWPQIEMLWRTIPQASLAVVPNCAHAWHLERPELFTTLLTEYLRRDQPSK
jgi:2-hydroxy-6-oxonona-2,4-dienedioate hydrolase